MFWDVFAILVMLVLSALFLTLDYFKIKSRWYKRLRFGALILLVITGVVEIINRSDEHINSANTDKQLIRIQTQNDSLKSILLASELSWREKMIGLQDSMSSLGEKFEYFRPFISLAVFRHPNLDTLTALRKLLVKLRL